MSDSPEVDAFGRIKPAKREIQEFRPRQYERNRSPPRQNRRQLEDRDRRFSDGKGSYRNERRGDSRDREMIPREKMDDWRGHEQDRGRGGPRMSGSGRGFLGRGDGSSMYPGEGANKLISPLQGQLPKRNVMRAMLSFKNFMATQTEDVPVETYQKKYEEYQIQYASDFSQNFFENNVNEEWFRERYDPLKIKELESEAAVWAIGESLRLKTMILEQPQLVIEGMRLDPPPPPFRRIDGGGKGALVPAVSTSSTPAIASSGEAISDGASADDQNNSSNIKLLTEDQDKKETGVESEEINELQKDSSNSGVTTDDTSLEIYKYGRHCSGHLLRTIYLTGVVAECTKLTLKNSLLEAISKVLPGGMPAAIAAVERLVVSAPSWNTHPNRTSSSHASRGFERNAWLVLAPNVSCQEILRALRGLVVSVPNPVDSASILAAVPAEVTERSSFTLQANIHSPKSMKVVPEFMSYLPRIVYDTEKAMQLAEQLDDDKNIPKEHRLSGILDSPLTSVTTTIPTTDEPSSSSSSSLTVNDWLIQSNHKADKLDFCIAYLRRVHFYVYYAGKKFRDEAQLISFSGSIVRRSIPSVAMASNSSNSEGSMGESTNRNHQLEPVPLTLPTTTVAVEESMNSVKRKRQEDNDDNDEDEADEDDESRGQLPLPTSDKVEMTEEVMLTTTGTTSESTLLGTSTTTTTVPSNKTATVEGDILMGDAADATGGAEVVMKSTEDEVTEKASSGEVTTTTTVQQPGEEGTIVATTLLQQTALSLGEAVEEDEGEVKESEQEEGEEIPGDEEEEDDEDGDNRHRQRRPSSDSSKAHWSRRFLPTSSSSTPATAIALSDKYKYGYDALDWKRDFTIGPIDRRNDSMIIELKSKANRLQNQQLSPEEEDIKLIVEENEKVTERWCEEMTKPEAEGKARCGIEWCNKLFKGVEFLRKHLRTRHIDMVTFRLTKTSEPFMRKKWEAEDILLRPLPPMPIELLSAASGVEFKTVREIYERCHRVPPQDSSTSSLGYGSSGGMSYGGRGSGGPSGFGRGGGRGRSGGGRDGSNRGGGGRGGGDRRWSTDGVRGSGGSGYGRGGGGGYLYHHNAPPPPYPPHYPPYPAGSGANYFDGYNPSMEAPRPPSFPPPYPHLPPPYPVGAPPPQPPSMMSSRQPPPPPPPPEQDSFKRRLQSYMDVDAPETTASSLNYGVTVLPPPKKRKLLQKRESL